MRRLALTLGQSAGGASGVPVLDASYSATSGLASAAKITFETDGSLTYEADGNPGDLAGWLSNKPDPTSAALYSVRRTQVSGTLGVTFTGTLNSGTWYPLTSTRGITVTSTLGVSRSNVSDWDIALTSDTTNVLASTTTTVTSDP